jgi:hypothetical protein
MVLQWCYSGNALDHSGVTVVLQWCYMVNRVAPAYAQGGSTEQRFPANDSGLRRVET